MLGLDEQVFLVFFSQEKSLKGYLGLLGAGATFDWRFFDN
jgi:hypothetical protein